MPDTGAPWFIPYVEGGDLVRDWPTDSLALANAIVAALEDIPVYQKRIAAFTANGTWTVPAGVTYAIAHMKGGGGGTSVDGADASAGGSSSVAFAGGTVSAAGGASFDLDTGTGIGTSIARVVVAPATNSGDGSRITGVEASNDAAFNAIAPSGAFVVAGDAVTPAASITVTVGAGGSAGANGGAGGSGYVYIEYYEEV